MAPLNDFKPNCTTPPETVNFVSTPNVRGSLDIVWTCLSILLLCTYKVLHQNVPLQSIPDSEDWKQNFYRSYFRTLHKIGWMLINLVAPEFILAKAWSDRKAVHIAHTNLGKWAKIDQVQWTRTHTHLANMGGFSIKFNLKQNEVADAMDGAHAVHNEADQAQKSCEPSSPSSKRDQLLGVRSDSQSGMGRIDVDVESANITPVPGPATSPQPSNITLATLPYHYIFNTLENQMRDDPPALTSTIEDSIKTWSHYIGSINWTVDSHNLRLVKEALRSVRRHQFTEGERRHFISVWMSWYRNLRALQGDLWILDAHQLCLARELGIIEKLPSVQQDDLDDRNKGDVFVTVVALGQIVRFVLQLVVRLSHGQSTSQLEIVTLAFAVVTAVTYCLLWGKPKDVTYSIILPAERHPRNKEDMIYLALVGPSTLLPWITTRSAASQQPASRTNAHPWSIQWVRLKIDDVLGWFCTQQWLRGPDSKRGALGLSSLPAYFDALGISNFDIHVNHDLKMKATHFSTCAIGGGGVALVLFGAIHCLAWDFSFATAAEKWLWRVSSILEVALPVCGILGQYLESRLWPHGSPFVELMNLGQWPIFMGSLAYYLFARGFILVEVFRSLAYLPPDAFETSWSANLPHIG